MNNSDAGSKIEDYYKGLYKGRRIVVIGRKGIIDDHIKNVRQQVKDVLSCDVAIDFVTNFPYEGKENKLQKLRVSDAIEIIKTNLHDEDLVDLAFDVACRRGISRIVQLETKALRDLSGNKLNNINSKNLAKIHLDKIFYNSVMRILGRISSHVGVERYHFVNVLRNKSLYKELFTFLGAGNGNGVMISDNFLIEFSSLSELDENVLSFMKKFLEFNSGFMKKREIADFVNDSENTILGILDGVPIGMFKIQYLDLDIIEVGAFNIDPNLQGIGLGMQFLDYIKKLKKKRTFRSRIFIFVTFNESLKNMLLKSGGHLVTIRDVSNKQIKLRNEKMIFDNNFDGKKRSMFIL